MTIGPVVISGGTFELGAPRITVLPDPAPGLSVPNVVPETRLVVPLPAGTSTLELLLDIVEEPGAGAAPLLNDPLGESAGLVLLPSVPELTVPEGETEPVPVPALP